MGLPVMAALFFFAYYSKIRDKAARNFGMGHCVSRSMMSVFSPANGQISSPMLFSERSVPK